ncbi:putative ATP-dependent RNA helicase TDRD12 isoform X1 [Pangasianodon hypophthalmus]|uniref:putative ATP-dependent RNA helicase TDRD12 isoform X1 n=1 Tax=Pangasianodon hypophthalmus TaxID=310915 RepID=UPI0023079095|nr:putative ATP-dependent RNA helicase TDRD12 isoform X1 [Pangasianodon hypophthalmus]XP_034163028.2 putative ATP-dependent RNA helicase TDRD12 isoform X1 [Pangasianodon hypophthalmus]
MEVGEMLELAIIKVEDPGCIWGRTVKGPGVQVGGPQDYETLQVKMNLFYHKVNLDVQKVKPLSLEKGQVCVVFWPALRSWCRAKVESLFLGSARSQATCFLVDHGERVVVSTDDVRAPVDKFLQLPFRVLRFKLARIHPMKLKVHICNETAELVPSPHWDSSATKYLHNLLQASTLVEAVLCGTHDDCTDIELYLTIRNVKVCVNDDLVVKKFACFLSARALGDQSGCVDRSPVSLAWDIFSSPQHILKMNGCCTVKSAPSHFLTRKSKKDDFMPQIEHVKSLMTAAKSVVPRGAVSPVENEESDGQEICGVHDTNADPKSTKEGNVKSGIDAGHQSSSTFVRDFEESYSENTESTLAEQLSEKLNLFRFLKFLNPFSNSNLGTKHDINEDSQKTSGISDETAVVQNDLSSTSVIPTVQKEPAVTQETTSTKDQFACARLLQLLNPDPVNPDSESLDNSVACCEPSKSGVLVHSAVTINPCRTLTQAPITEQFRKFLLRRKYTGPGLAESYCWPSVARGCDTVLICHSREDPLSYIPPLLAQLQLASLFSAITAHTGPIAVIVCPGWEKVESVLQLLEESQAAVNLHPAAVLVGIGKNEARQTKIQNNCQLVVTTPFSLARLLEVQFFLFHRLCHLILDEAHELFSRAPEQMTAILQHYQKVVSRAERTMCVQQIVAVDSRWCRELETVVRNHMVNPCIIITVPEEAALYGGVQQTILMCLDCNKTSVLLSSLDFSPSVPQKTLLITNSAEEVEHVYKALSNTAAFSLKVHEGLTYQFDFVIEQWRKDIGPGTQVILVITNDCLKALGIRDATCVVHYGFPSSPKLFGNRMFCMVENFQNLSSKSVLGQNQSEGSSPAVRSVLLLSEQNARHVSGVLRYLKRTDAPLPPELLQFAQGVQQAKEQWKADRALCSYLKSLGFCRDSTSCPDRHTINKILDCPQHPDSGTVLVLPLYIKTASVYYGRIVDQKENGYEKLAAEMKSHYAKERLCAKEVVEGGFYAVQEEDVYHRVCVTMVPDKGDRLFSSVTARFVDEGRIQEVKSHQLLQLPPEFQSLSGQAVEIILCRAQPIDGEMDWNPKVTRAISLKIKGKIHHAKVVMCLGNTVWVDPMVCMTRMPGLKIFINEYNVHAEIVATGMGTTNPQHLELLKLLCQREEVSAVVKLSESNGCESEVASLEQRAQAAEEALASQVKAGINISERTDTEPCDPCEPLQNLQNIKQITEPNRRQSEVSLEAWPDAEHMVTSADLRCLPQNGTPALFNSSDEDDCNIKNEDLHTGCRQDIAIPKSFHPQIKWFQEEESVTLKIKLTNPMMQKCDFFSDRVLYSAYVNSHHYCANLELHSDISTEQCSWKTECNEPVIKLVKKEKGEWKSLLKYKSAFVSYDFDHIEVEEIPPSNGCWFVGNTGEEGCYWNSESGSESD